MNIMLVLGRKAGQRIRIGDDIFITVVAMKEGRCKIGIEAPKTTRVVRDELEPLTEEDTIDASLAETLDADSLAEVMAAKAS